MERTLSIRRSLQAGIHKSIDDIETGKAEEMKPEWTLTGIISIWATLARLSFLPPAATVALCGDSFLQQQATPLLIYLSIYSVKHTYTLQQNHGHHGHHHHHHVLLTRTGGKPPHRPRKTKQHPLYTARRPKLTSRRTRSSCSQPRSTACAPSRRSTAPTPP